MRVCGCYERVGVTRGCVKRGLMIRVGGCGWVGWRLHRVRGRETGVREGCERGGEWVCGVMR